MRRLGYRLRLGVLGLAVVFCVGALFDRTAAANSIPYLGSADGYAVIGLAGTQSKIDTINNSLVTINGNEAIGQYGSLVNMAPSVINGNVYEYSSGEYSGPGALKGSLFVNPTLLTQINQDALNAASVAKNETVTQPSFGSISSATTINGNGSLNVIDINGDIKSSVILHGTANDIFVINVNGNLALGGSDVLGLSGGTLASRVMYNFVGSSGSISTHVGNVLNGTLLAPNYNFQLDGTFNGQIIGGGAGNTIALLSGAVVNAVPFVPLPSSLGGGIVLLAITGAVVGSRRRRIQQ